jgi:hypothetical protein
MTHSNNWDYEHKNHKNEVGIAATDNSSGNAAFGVRPINRLC